MSEIREKIFNWVKEYGYPRRDDEITILSNSIKDVLVKRLKGKVKQGIKFHSGRQNCELSAYSPTDNQKVGYNQALSDAIKAIREG